MPIRAHIADLEERHRMLEAELASAHAHVSIDHLEIAELKRRKLLVKDKIAKLRSRVAAEAAARLGPATPSRPCERCGGSMVVVRSIPQLGPELPEVRLFQCGDCGDVHQPSSPQPTRKSKAPDVIAVAGGALRSLAKRLGLRTP
jgi:hypothetical protein